MRVIFVTAPPALAPTLVRTLVEERLIACGNILPGVRSIYRWEGRVCDDEEVVVLMETTADRLSVATQRLRELHSYTCPKIIALEPSYVNEDYAAWARAETRPT